MLPATLPKLGIYYHVIRGKPIGGLSHRDAGVDIDMAAVVAPDRACAFTRVFKFRACAFTRVFKFHDERVFAIGHLIAHAGDSLQVEISGVETEWRS
jgi:hypothetical protein